MHNSHESPPQNVKLCEYHKRVQMGSSHHLLPPRRDVFVRKLLRHADSKAVVDCNHRRELSNWIHWNNVGSPPSQSLSRGWRVAVSSNNVRQLIVILVLHQQAVDGLRNISNERNHRSEWHQEKSVPESDIVRSPHAAPLVSHARSQFISAIQRTFLGYLPGVWDSVAGVSMVAAYSRSVPATAENQNEEFEGNEVLSSFASKIFRFDNKNDCEPNFYTQQKSTTLIN